MTRNHARLVFYGGLITASIVVVLAWQWACGALPAAGSCDRGDNGLWMRRQWLHGGSRPPELMLSAVASLGVLRGLADEPLPKNFRGAAVYASWTTDAQEWDTYLRLWRDRPPQGKTVPEVP